MYKGPSDTVVDVMQTNLLSSAHERTIAQTINSSVIYSQEDICEVNELVFQETAERTDLPSSARDRTIAHTVDCPAFLTLKEIFDVNKVVPQ